MIYIYIFIDDLYHANADFFLAGGKGVVRSKKIFAHLFVYSRSVLLHCLIFNTIVVLKYVVFYVILAM